MSDQSNIFERGFADAAGLTDPTRDNEAIDATMFELYKAGAVGSTTSKLKMYVGGVWVAKPLKKYVDGVWVEHPLKYLSNEQKARITILQSDDGKPLRSADGKVLIRGDWPPDFYLPENGLLYNLYAATDIRKISSSDDWVVMTQPNYNNMCLAIGGYSVAGGKLKETGFTYWNSPNTGATNEFGFNARGSGYRVSSGGFSGFKTVLIFWTNTLYVTENYVATIQNNTASSSSGAGSSPKTGCAIRLLYAGTGTPDFYTGNDGKVYRIVKIGTQYWLADNLAETKFRNGDTIPWYGANPANYFTDAEWAALTTAGVCSYLNNLSNVGPGFSFPG